MFVHLTKRTKFLVRVRLSNKRTNTNELPAERFTNCSPNVWFVCNPIHTHKEFGPLVGHCKPFCGFWVRRWKCWCGGCVKQRREGVAEVNFFWVGGG
ncbi:hypothetical protein Hanom_Chr09g00862951 [Helianthus anomalus]